MAVIGAGTTSPRFGFAATANWLQLGDGATSPVGAADTARFRYIDSTGKAQVSLDGAAYLDLTLLAAALTAGSVVFADASGNLAQDNANLFWDDTNNRLGIGNAAPAQALHVTGTARATTGLIVDTMTAGSVWFAGASGALTQDNANLFWDDSNNRLGIGTATPAVALDLATGTAEAGIQFRIGTTLAVSAANTGRIRYNATTQVFEVSLNGGAYTTLTSDPVITAVKTANYSAVLGDFVRCDPSGGVFTVTLPALATASIGKVINVKNTTSSATQITINPTGADTIDTAASTSIAAGFASLSFIATTASTWAIY
jgi:hypothetical protein